MKIATLSKLSICPCGFPVLKDEIGLGEQYECEPDVSHVATFVCGGCKREFQIPVIYVYDKPGRHGGYLPKEILTVEPS